MTWHGICGHDEVAERFRLALERGRMASSFLFVGPAGIGKHCFALKLAQALLCQTRPAAALDPCGECPACRQVSARTHPDLLLVAKPKEKSAIPLELLIGDKEHRMRQGLCHDIAMKPFMGGRKVAVIDDADYLGVEGANCLLKTLEEPPPRSVLILISTSPARQLPTIRSRCQLIRFRPLPPDVVAELLVAHQYVDEPAEARRLAGHGEGSLQRALELAEPELWTFRETLLGRLAEPVLQSARLSKAVGTFVEGAGREAALRRGRMRQVVSLAIEFYRRLLYGLSGATLPGDSELDALVQQMLARGSCEEPTITACLDRCLEVLGQIDRNANQATLTECWLDDLSRIVASGG